MKLSRLLSPLRLGAGALLLAVALAPCAARAADDGPPELATKTSDALTKLSPLLDAKNWDGAIELINSAIANVDPDSFDRAYGEDMLGKLYVEKDDFPHAIAALEVALQLTTAHPNYFNKKDTLELILSLAQVSSQFSFATKDPAQQKEYSEKATKYTKQWLALTDKPTADVETFYASVLYQQATANDKDINMDLLAQSQRAALKATELTLHPKETAYEIIFATYAQQQDFPNTAKYLELLAAMYPKKTYWTQLVGVYVNLASEQSEKDPELSRKYYIRAILTVDRAQAYGQMRTPNDYYRLFQMYYTTGQVVEATDLLYTGMKDGRIDSTEKNWLQLAGALQEDSQFVKAIEVLKEAEKRFPESGEMDFQIAQIYSAQLDNQKAAYEYILPAVKKGHLESAFNTYFRMAYLCYNLEKFPEALEAAKKAEALPQGAQNKQLKTLDEQIELSIKMQQQAASAGAPPPPAPSTTQ